MYLSYEESINCSSYQRKQVAKYFQMKIKMGDVCVSYHYIQIFMKILTGSCKLF